jgi:hypothetical protein
MWQKDVDKRTTRFDDLVERHPTADIDAMSDDDARDTLRHTTDAITLAEASIIAAGNSRPITVPIMRIPVEHIAGWWLLETDEEGRASLEHPR